MCEIGFLRQGTQNVDTPFMYDCANTLGTYNPSILVYNIIEGKGTNKY